MLWVADKVRGIYTADNYYPTELNTLQLNFYDQKSKLYPDVDLYPAGKVYPSERVKATFTFDESDIVSESMTIPEGLCDTDKIDYRSCVSSSLAIEITDVQQDVQDMEIEVIQILINEEGDEEYQVPLFEGIVDTAQKNGDKTRRKIKAYDYLYYRYNENIIDWYNSLTFPMKCKDLRIALYRAYNMPYVVQDLVNDNIYINKSDIDELNGRELLKMIGEFNGAFVHINRSNQIKFISLDRYNYIYPDNSRLPDTFYPGAQTDAHGFEHAEVYIDCEYGDYRVQEINRITVKEQDSLLGVYGSGTNTYEIIDNILFRGMDGEVITSALSNIYSKIGGIWYVPHKTTIKGRPYVECGDVINVQISPNKSIDTYVFKRTLKGVYAMKDTYEANGDEYHNKLYEVEEWTE